MSGKKCLYAALVGRGGRVANQAEWRELGQSCGYTARGDLAGYHGGTAPSMVQLPDGSRELTSDGWRRATNI